MREVLLSSGQVAIVSACDYDLVSQYKWRLHNAGYARSSTSRAKGLVRKDFLMHRLIMGFPHFPIDHINGDKLDNRRENLRRATKAINAMNAGKRRGTSSRYKGVCWNNLSRKWQANIHNVNRCVYLGLYLVEEDAAQAYNKAAAELFGEYAKFNILKEEGIHNEAVTSNV